MSRGHTAVRVQKPFVANLRVHPQPAEGEARRFHDPGLKTILSVPRIQKVSSETSAPSIAAIGKAYAAPERHAVVV